MKAVVKTLLGMSLLLPAMPPGAAELLREFRGSGNTTTAEFAVESPWIIDWRLDSDFEHQVSLDMVLIDAASGRFIGAVKSGARQNVTDRSNGVRLFRMSGRYKLRISSSLARWTIKIQQLSDEEAELYTPIGADR